MSKKGRDRDWEAGWAAGRFTRLVRDLSTMLPSLSERLDEESGPLVDMLDRGDAFVLRIEVPGLGPGDLKLSIGGGALVVEGYKRRRRETGCLGYLCLERSYGYFKRAVDLPGPVDPSGVSARLEDGLLVVEVPRVADRRREHTVIPISD